MDHSQECWTHIKSELDSLIKAALSKKQYAWNMQAMIENTINMPAYDGYGLREYLRQRAFEYIEENYWNKQPKPKGK